MENATELANYLPLSYKTPKEQEYIEFLWDAFETNYTLGKYPFAFLAYPMLKMSFVYFNIWQIKQTEPKDFAMCLIGFGKDIEKSLAPRRLHPLKKSLNFPINCRCRSRCQRSRN